MLSDADVVATAYTDGQLGDATGPDHLSLVSLVGDDVGAVASTAVSNSVVARRGPHSMILVP